jgi:hypothetical protein
MLCCLSALILSKLYTNSLLMLFNNRAIFSHTGTSTQASRNGLLAPQNNLAKLTSPTRAKKHSKERFKPGFITVTTESVTDGGNPISMSNLHVSFTATRFIMAWNKICIADNQTWYRQIDRVWSWHLAITVLAEGPWSWARPISNPVL